MLIETYNDRIMLNKPVDDITVKDRIKSFKLECNCMGCKNMMDYCYKKKK